LNTIEVWFLEQFIFLRSKTEGLLISMLIKGKIQSTRPDLKKLCMNYIMNQFLLKSIDNLLISTVHWIFLIDLTFSFLNRYSLVSSNTLYCFLLNHFSSIQMLLYIFKYLRHCFKEIMRMTVRILSSLNLFFCWIQVLNGKLASLINLQSTNPMLFGLLIQLKKLSQNKSFK